jgi:glyoxylase I family protein
VAEVIGIDHIYVTVSDLEASEQFYDRVMIDVFAFRKNKFSLAGDRHFNRHFGFVLRPSRASAKHDPYSAGLHHVCLRVDSAADVYAVANELRTRGVNATEPRLYPEYANDYTATFFEGPDGIRLEVTNYRQERRERHDHWHHGAGEQPVAAEGDR